ncbi:hypothetical protein DRQ33_06690 [bacterium]|nr:MAG: hypothetical protein DRQ33_06690 [bacterium]
MKKNIKYWQLIPMILILLLSGCTTGVDENEDDDGNSIKVGVILPFSGECAAFASSEMQAIQMAVEEINSAGGVLGKPIELVVRDSRSDPFLGSLTAREFVEQENVVAILSADASPVSVAIRDMIVDFNMIQISGSSGAYRLTTDDLNDSVFYRTVLSDYYQSRIIADKLADMGESAVRVIYVNDDYGIGMAERFKNRFEYYGVVEKMVPFDMGKVSYTAEIETLFSDVVDTSDSDKTDTDFRIFMIAYPKCGAQIIRDWRASGYGGKWILSDALKAEEFIKYAGKNNVEGIIGVSPYWGGINYQYFQDDYEDFTGEDARKHRSLENWYDAMILLAYAILYADTLDPYSIGRALKTVSTSPGDTVNYGEFSRGKAIISNITVVDETLEVRGDINYEGASGSVDLDNNGDVENGRYELWQIQNGQFVHLEELIP